MTNCEKLKQWYDEQRKNGLEDCHLSLNPDIDKNTEEVAGDILMVLANLDLTSPLENI
jgi:hypothetical protein